MCYVIISKVLLVYCQCFDKTFETVYNSIKNNNSLIRVLIKLLSDICTHSKKKTSQSENCIQYIKYCDWSIFFSLVTNLMLRKDYDNMIRII